MEELYQLVEAYLKEHPGCVSPLTYRAVFGPQRLKEIILESKGREIEFVFYKNSPRKISFKYKKARMNNNLQSTVEEHPFLPFVPSNVRYLILGTFPGWEQVRDRMDREQWFYSAKSNNFWDILSEIYNKKLITRTDKEKLFITHGIAITDIYLKVKRRNPNSNLDSNLYEQEHNFNEIKKILNIPNIKVLFTSKEVGKKFSEQFPDFKNCTNLLSPSNAANRSIGRSPDYKQYRIENPSGNTISYRVMKYKELLNPEQ